MPIHGKCAMVFVIHDQPFLTLNWITCNLFLLDVMACINLQQNHVFFASGIVNRLNLKPRLIMFVSTKMTNYVCFDWNENRCVWLTVNRYLFKDLECDTNGRLIAYVNFRPWL
jgi:hypothetical protein